MSDLAKRQYLVDYLAEEFSGFPDVRVRAAPRKRVDVSEKEHYVEDSPGVIVKTGSREYLFPYEWTEGSRFGEVARLVSRIKDTL